MADLVNPGLCDRWAMARRTAPDLETTRYLYLHSGNQCAFPECENVLMNYKAQWVGQICHIEAASPGGERFNPNLSLRERAQRENLVLFCHEHHIETNDVDEFPAERLRQIKADHEQRFAAPLPVSDEVLERAVQNIIAASIDDVTDRVVLHLPESMEAFSAGMDYRESSEERLISLTKLTPTLEALRRLPVDTRAVFAILLDRVAPGERTELPLFELEQVTRLSVAEMEPHVALLERYGLAGRDEEYFEDRPSYFKLIAYEIDGWEFWRDFRTFCHNRGLSAKEIINELQFDVLDE